MFGNIFVFIAAIVISAIIGFIFGAVYATDNINEFDDWVDYDKQGNH